jgi:anti-sigma factor RsiW
MKQVVAWLGEHHGENNFVLPVALNGDTGLMGCRVLDWRGQKVSMLCYGVNGSGHVDLFVAKSNVFPDAPPEDKPQFVSSGGMPTASWSHNGMAYLMVGHGDEAALERILQPKAAATWRSPVDISFKLASASNFQKDYLE